MGSDADQGCLSQISDPHPTIFKFWIPGPNKIKNYQWYLSCTLWFPEQEKIYPESRYRIQMVKSIGSRIRFRTIVDGLSFNNSTVLSKYIWLSGPWNPTLEIVLEPVQQIRGIPVCYFKPVYFWYQLLIEYWPRMYRQNLSFTVHSKKWLSHKFKNVGCDNGNQSINLYLHLTANTF
jgi:hypothetical protein